MNDFPLDQEEWYRIRDDRTRRVDGASGFENYSLGVVIDPKQELSYAVQVMALIALNILARWCRKIRIEMPKETVSCLPYRKGQNFQEVLGQMMKDADPYGNFTFGPISEQDINQVLLISQNSRSSMKPSVRIDGWGWIAGINNGAELAVHPAYDENPIGPAFASCLGVAEIFRQAVGLPSTNSCSSWYSLFDLERDENPTQLSNPQYHSQLDLGRIHQVGCGAVGSSLDFLFSLTGWRAELFLVDYDKVDFTNCNRSLCLNPFDGVRKKYKVDACAEALRSSGLQPIPFASSYDQFVGRGHFLDNPPDIILCLANEQNIWGCIQHNFPPLVLHATTTPNWGLNFGRHIPLKEWCIMCRFADEVTHEFTPECSTGHLEVMGNKRNTTLGVLPFLSTAGAIMILSELEKLGKSEYPVNKNFIQYSMRTPKASFVQMQRHRKEGCICREQTLNLYPSQIRNTKYWKLVTAEQSDLYREEETRGR
jgi:hypothetical protein